MARDLDGPSNRDALEPGEGRRIGRAPEPRPAPETAARSVLLMRHRPDSAALKPMIDENALLGDQEAAETPWPAEQAPIDFNDLDSIRDDLDHEQPIAVDTEVTPAFDEGLRSKQGANRGVQPSRIRATPGRTSLHQPNGDMAARTSGRAASPQASNPVVPPQSVAGRALMLVVGIMCFLACLAVGALVLVEDAARDWQLDVSREVTVQVKPVDGKPIEPMLQTAMDLARATQGVRNVRLMSERDSEALLEPWLGTSFDYSKLPVPRLILIELSDPSSADLSGLGQRLSASLPNAELDDHSIWAKRLRTMAGTMVAAGVVVLVLVLTAMVLSVVFATRAAMAGNRDVVQVLHFVGAEDSFIAGEFQHHFLILGFKGGIGGGAGAMLAFLVANWLTEETQGMPGSDQAHALFGGFSVGLNGYLGAAGIVLLVAGLTALTSRLTVRSYLDQLD